ncbi:uncharacterized protein LOC111260313 [Varroa jacobsoni]|uniref:uncharacterized protein LOC111260313 n=1 Tax=Varroa jacobsoni TaxID=62625 RepID=UPI000BF46894|nr:uncharacterized protein LOC111260313 [Varroa jacobsoni]
MTGQKHFHANSDLCLGAFYTAAPASSRFPCQRGCNRTTVVLILATDNVSSCAYNVTLCRAHHNANRLGSVSDATRYRTLKAVRPGLQLRNQPQNAGIIVIIRAAKEHKNYETRLLTRGPAHSNTSRVGTE